MRRPALTLAALILAVPMLAAAAPADAACDVTGAKIEETIAGKGTLREGANAQIVRDLRTLRDAAIVLDTYKYPGECEILLGIARTLAAHPDKTIEQGGDTDEDKAESLVEARKPKSPEKSPAEAPAGAKAN